MKIYTEDGKLTIEMLLFSDGHGHLREGPLMDLIIWAYGLYLYVVCMGNTKEPIRNATDANRYRMEIVSHKQNFIPVMTVMLNEEMLLPNGKANKEMLRQIYNAGVRIIKFIPADTSTNAVIKITLPDLVKYYPALDFWATLPGTIFSIHLELINSINGILIPEIERETEGLPYGEELVIRYSGSSMKISFEHASTIGLINLVRNAHKKAGNFFASLITTHATTTYDMVRDPKTGKMLNPYLYCMPIAKTPEDVKAVRGAMVNMEPCFYSGNDCAAHWPEDKQGEKIKPGNFTPYKIAIPQLVQIFAEERKLFKRGWELNEALEYFASLSFINFFGNGLKHNGQTIVIQKDPWIVPEDYNGIVPGAAGKLLQWKVKGIKTN